MVVAGLAVEARAGACSVPGSHSSIQFAIDDVECTEIALAEQEYFENLEIHRSVALIGPGGSIATLAGQVLLTGNATVATLAHIGVISQCAGGSVRILGGAQVRMLGSEIHYSSRVTCSTGPIFADGFEG